MLNGMFGIALISLWDVWDYPDVVSSSSDEEAEVVHLVHTFRAEESLKQHHYLIFHSKQKIFQSNIVKDNKGNFKSISFLFLEWFQNLYIDGLTWCLAPQKPKPGQKGQGQLSL